MDLATREILWNIPFSFKVTMYGLFILSLAVLAKGLFEKYQYVTAGKGLKALLPKN
jgi:hypothetical protein